MTQTRQDLLHEAKEIGTSTLKVAQSIFEIKEVDGMRPVRLLLRLGKTYSLSDLESACKRALDYETPAYGSVKNILKKGMQDEPPPFKAAEEQTAPALESPPCKSFRFSRPIGYFSGKAISFISMFTGVFNHG